MDADTVVLVPTYNKGDPDNPGSYHPTDIDIPGHGKNRSGDYEEATGGLLSERGILVFCTAWKGPIREGARQSGHWLLC